MNALRPILAAAALCTAVPAFAGGRFMLVNGTGQALSSLDMRPSAGGPWRKLGTGGAGAGSRQAIEISGEQCAFDIRAALSGGGKVVWSDVNLCETKAVILQRRPDGTSWVDYD